MNESESQADDIPQKRISDVERNIVIDRLNAAASKGFITMDELADRSLIVYDAKHSYQLEPVVADLPELAPLPFRESRKWRWLVSILGGRDWVGSWRPAAKNVTITLMAGQSIDLTEANAETVSIYALTIMGGIDIIVPDHADVDVSGFMLMGGSSFDVAANDGSGMKITIHSWGFMGGCEVWSSSASDSVSRSG